MWEGGVCVWYVLGESESTHTHPTKMGERVWSLPSSVFAALGKYARYKFISSGVQFTSS